VTDSAGLNLPPAEQLKDPRSRIIRLEDTNNDGRFDHARVFADRVMFPQGCLWHAGSVYVAGPPSIWKFTDADGDGHAEKREEWYKGKVLTGCANDVHGPYLGPEGMLYWTKGAFQRLDLVDYHGRPVNDRCAHVFRAWPDRTGMEVVISGGMDNPVEVAFTAEGEPIVISTFIDLSQPGRRDGLAHAIHGGVFGKVNDGVDEPMVKRTGDLLPAMTHYGPAAACALLRYEGNGFGAEYRDNLFATLFNLRKVTRHVLEPKGVTYVTHDSDFLVSDQMDFHPTDLVEDADGSLLVIDTGGWYKLCCPSSQLAKADVLGGIYRVRRAASEPMNPSERRARYAQLTEPPHLRDNPEAELKRVALNPGADAAPLLLASLGRHGSRAAGSAESARLVRIAAEGLGRLRDATAIPLLFEAIRSAPEDRFLEHSLFFALIEIGNAEATRSFAKSNEAAVRRAALLALEQIGEGALEAADVIPWLNDSSTPLRETARWIAKRHPEWGDAIVERVRRGLDQAEPAAMEDRVKLFGLLPGSSAGQVFLGEVARQRKYDDRTRIAAFEAMAKSGIRQLPENWREAVVTALAGEAAPASAGPGEKEPVARSALRAVRSLPLPKGGDDTITAALRRLGANENLTQDLRLDAMAALPAGVTVDDRGFRVLAKSLDAERHPDQRLAAANALARMRLSSNQLEALTPAVAMAGPLELPRLVAAFGSGSGEALGWKLVEALKSSRGLRSLRAEEIRPHLAGFPEAVARAAEELLKNNGSDASRERAQLDALMAELRQRPGDIRRGQSIFNSARAACSSCHRMGYLGGDVGPDLTSIGGSRTELDLLEAVVYPSASFVRSYEPWTATLKDGEEHSGVLRRESAAEIVLATGPGAELRIDRSDLAELRAGTVSTMPAGLDGQLTRQELADLLAFLKNTKWGVN
jgi:putative membrane-bound dehydrogenase-like protein